MNVIEIKNVTQSFRQGFSQGFCQKNILEDINLTIQAGEFVWLKGINGAGKTTLFTLALGLTTPSQGEVKLMGLDPRDANAKLDIGVVFQEVQVPKNVKVKEIIKLFQSYSPNPLSLSLEEILTQVNLTKPGISNAYTPSMSGGEKQRLQLALALSGNPKLLILDEPTRNLDPQSYKVFWEQIKLCHERGVTILITTQIDSDSQELDKLATRIVTLHEISVAPAEGQLTEEFSTVNTDASELSTTEDEEISNETPSRNILDIFGKQLWFECLQLLRTPTFLLATLSFVGFVPLLKSQYQGQKALVPLIYLCGVILFTIVIERLGKRVAVERSEGWLKLLKTTSLPPVIYMAAKISSLLIVCAVAVLSIFALGSWQLGIDGSLGLWSTTFLSLIIGIVPFAILGLGLGYWLHPKSTDSVLSLSLFVLPFICGAIPSPFKPELMRDLVSLSPFYHYRAVVLSAAQIYNDGQLFLHLLWLIWACGVFGLSAIWVYQRDRAIQ